MKTCKKTTGLVIMLICAMLITMFSLAGCQNTGTQNDQPTKEPTQGTTAPEVTDPEVTDPEVTDPEVTEPEVTEPEVTDPEVTEPPVTEPPVTEPPVTEPPVTEPKKTNRELAQEVIEGLWGNGLARKNRLIAAGYDFSAIQKIVNELMPDMGERLNPEVVKELGLIDMKMEANQPYGYYYSWTAEETGYLTVFITSITEGVEGEIYMRNLTTNELVQLTKDGVDNFGLELSIDVQKGDTVYIQLLTQPGENGKRPAADISWASAFFYPKGSELNPIYPEFVWNNEGTEATATTKVPAGQTYYYGVYGAAGMLLTVDQNEPILLTAEGMGRAPAFFTVKNDGTAEKEFALKLTYPEGHYMNPKVLEELLYTETELKLDANDADGYYYTYTAPEDGTITLYINSITENVEADIVVMNGYTQKTLLADGVDNYGLELTVDVKKGDEVMIQVVVIPDASWNRPAAEIKWFGNFTYYAGHEQNPCFPEFQWNNEQTEATATVKVPAGKTYHFGAYGANGMLLSIDGAEPTVLTAQGMGRTPAYFTITNDGTAEKEYALKLFYPLGVRENPEVLEELGWFDLELPEADMFSQGNGYYYTYTAPADGTILFYVGSITEGVTGDIVVTNNTTYEQMSLLNDGVDNYGLELTVEVSEGDELVIMVVTQVDTATYTYPAAELTWCGQFNYPLGSEQNPIEIDWQFNEEYTEATAKVKVPAGAKYYYAANGGMCLSVDGGEPTLLVAPGFRMPAIFSLDNTAGTEEKEFSLKLTYPLGSRENPVVLGELAYTYTDLQLEAGDNDGFYYSWTAPEDGPVVFYFGWSEIDLDSICDIVVTNMSTYQQLTLQEDGVDNYGLELEVDVTKGDVLIIQVLAMPDQDYVIPAVELTWCGNFTYPEGSEQNPIYPEWEWNIDGSVATATVTVPAGTTYFFGSNSGMLLSIDGGEAVLMNDEAIKLTNDGTEAKEYTLVISYPVGAAENPEVIAVGTHTTTVAEGTYGYYYTWTATEAGTLTITMPSTGDWFYCVNNLTSYQYGDWQYSDADPAVPVTNLTVAAGDKIQIQINTYEPGSWVAPAGTVEWTLSFTAA